jgi:ABC-type polar amino acid transport system ATPase subunit
VATTLTTLAVSGLSVQRDARLIVRDVSFSVMRGERVAVMGASGTGKSTVLRAIAGLEPPSSGSIDVQGVGMVFQFHHLFAHMTALENVWLALVHVCRRPRREAEDRARALLEKVGVAHRRDAMPHELSGGEAQRVAIARALAVNPPVLLMDEPTASLDPARRDDLAATLRQLSADGTTIVVATHDVDFVRSCVERVLLMDDGRVIRDGAPADVLS